MADNTTVADETRSKPTSLIKGQSGSSGTGSMSSTTSSKHSLKHGLNMGHSTSGLKAATINASPDINKHHHHHHQHHHHHGHSHSNPHVIHRTTSESLRLGSDIVSSPVSGHSSSSPSTNCNSSASNTTSSSHSAHTSAPITIQRKPKTSSFQITSVTVGNKLSADNGEDSADDLDESHTDDNSRITDLENETPSVSEDTFSKEDVFFSSNALGAAPVIPTSSQYGLVIVDPDLGGVGNGGQTLSNVHVSVTDAGINIVGPAGTKLCDADQKDLQHRNERFKVVKIESTEPFKRGRWMCMDYLDHTTLQQSQPNSENTSTAPSGGTTSGTTGNPLTNDSGVNVTENHIDGTEDPPDINTQIHMQSLPVSPGQTLQNPISTSSVEQPQTGAGNVQNAIHAQTLTHVPNAPQVNMSHQNVIAQSLPHVPIQQIQQNITGQQSSTTQQPPQPSVDFTSVSNSSMQGQSQPAQFYANSQHHQNVTTSHIHGATLPTNITMQNGVPTNLGPLIEQQDVSQSIQPIQPVQNVQQMQPVQQNPISSTTASTVPVVSNAGLPEHGSIPVATSIPQPMVQQQLPQQSAPLAGSVLHQQPQLQSQNLPQSQVSSESYVAQSYGAPPVGATAISNVAGTSAGQEINVDGTIVMSQTPQSGVISPAGAGTPASTVPPIDAGNIQSCPQPGIVSSVSSVIPEAGSTSSASTISDPTALINVSQPQSQVSITPSLQTQQSVIGSEESQSVAGETDNESASGTSAVAIDNKIEQAMDLVKSHLMIAVREEVEVLKEKIAELMDRINQLELENTILKANVSQETLTQLSATMQTAATANTTTTATTTIPQQQPPPSQQTTTQQPKPSQNTNTSNGPVS